MAKSKDRLMLEKILDRAAADNIYQDLCNDGKEILKNLAKHLNKPLSYVCGDPVERSLHIYTDNFEIPDMFEDDDSEAENVLTVEVIVKKGNKKLNASVSSFYFD